jgi:hypothetical protein
MSCSTVCCRLHALQTHKQELLQLQTAHDEELRALQNRHDARLCTLQRELALSRAQHAAELKVSCTLLAGLTFLLFKC